MDTRVPAAEGGWPSQAGDSVEERLAAIERRLTALEQTVVEELGGTNEEMRRSVSDLGRLLLRDLDRLTKVLAEHRDAIVDRVTAVVTPPPPPPPLAAAAPAPAGAAAAPAPAPAADPARPDGDESRWRGPRRRKGQPAGADAKDKSKAKAEKGGEAQGE